jgi:hypothetical protein
LWGHTIAVWVAQSGSLPHFTPLSENDCGSTCFSEFKINFQGSVENVHFPVNTQNVTVIWNLEITTPTKLTFGIQEQWRSSFATKFFFAPQQGHYNRCVIQKIRTQNDVKIQKSGDEVGSICME